MIRSRACFNFGSERNALISRASVVSPGLTKSSAWPVRIASVMWPKRSAKEKAVGFFSGEKPLGHFAKQAGAHRRVALDLVAGKAERRGVEAAGKRQRVAGRAVQRGRARLETAEKIGHRRALLHRGVGLAGMQAAMIVGGTEKDLLMRFGMGRLEPVTLGQFGDFLRRQGAKTTVAHFLGKRLAIAVAALEIAEEQHQPLNVLHREDLVDVDQGMRDAVRQALLAQVGGQLVNHRAQLLNFFVLALVQIPDEEMDLAAVGEIGRHLLAEENVGVVGDRLGAIEPVVVGDGLEGHARGVELAVERLRLAVTLRHAEPAQNPLGRAVGKTRVKLEVNAQHGRRRWWVESRA